MASSYYPKWNKTKHISKCLPKTRNIIYVKNSNVYENENVEKINENKLLIKKNQVVKGKNYAIEVIAKTKSE